MQFLCVFLVALLCTATVLPIEQLRHRSERILRGELDTAQRFDTDAVAAAMDNDDTEERDNRPVFGRLTALNADLRPQMPVDVVSGADAQEGYRLGGVPLLTIALLVVLCVALFL